MEMYDLGSIFITPPPPNLDEGPVFLNGTNLKRVSAEASGGQLLNLPAPTILEPPL